MFCPLVLLLEYQMQIYFMKNIFFSPSLLHFMQGRKKRCQWVQKALKSHMKIENITSVHNYFMLHITCSTKSQMTLCSSVPDMPIIGGGGRMYWNSYLNVVRGSLYTRLRRGPLVFKMNWKWDVLVIMGVPACPPCDADYELVLKHWPSSRTYNKLCFLYCLKFTVLDSVFLQINSMKSRDYPQCYCTSPARGMAEQ